MPPTTDGVTPRSDAHVLDLFDPRLRAFLVELEEVATRHGRDLSLLGLIGHVELHFDGHGYRHARADMFLKPSLRVRRRREAARTVAP